MAQVKLAGGGETALLVDEVKGCPLEDDTACVMIGFVSVGIDTRSLSGSSGCSVWVKTCRSYKSSVVNLNLKLTVICDKPELEAQ